MNNGSAAVDLSALEIGYCFTADGKSRNGLKFWCDHAAISGSGYTAVTSSVNAQFAAETGAGYDTKCRIKFGSGKLNAGDTLTVQGRITAEDWSSFDLSNDARTLTIK